MPTIRARSGKFQAQVRVKSDGVIVHQESATFLTRKQAELWGLTLEKKLADGGWAERKQMQVTLSKLLDTHLAYLESMGKPTLAYAGRIKNVKASSLGLKQLGKITSSDLVAWASEFSVGRAPATVLNHLMAVSAAYRSGPLAHRIESDVRIVANAIGYLKQHGVAAVSVNRDRRVTDEEMLAIANQHAGLFDVTIPMNHIVPLLVALPRRRGELMKAKWSDYDAEKSTLALWDTKNPTKVRHEVVPVPSEAQAILAQLPRKSDRILPYKAQSVSTAFHRAAVMCGFDNLHLHDLRHEGISRLFDKGLDIPQVALISGHLSWTTLKRYTHIKPQTVLDKLNAYKQKAQEACAEPA
jgi:integrase